jgi:hypothetical protein
METYGCLLGCTGWKRWTGEKQDNSNGRRTLIPLRMKYKTVLTRPRTPFPHSSRELWSATGLVRWRKAESIRKQPSLLEARTFLSGLFCDYIIHRCTVPQTWVSMHSGAHPLSPDQKYVILQS